MIKLWEKWWLIVRLRRYIIKNTSNDKKMVTAKIIVNYEPYIQLSFFLEKITSNFLFIFKRADKHKHALIFKYKKMLESCAVPPESYVKIVTGKDIEMDATLKAHVLNENFIIITGKGDEYASFSNALVDFANKYKIIWALVLGIILIAPQVQNFVFYIMDYFY